jgi:hypothetical protein
MREVEADLKAAAKERQREHGGTAPGRKNTSGKLPGVSKDKPAPQARDHVAKAAGGISDQTHVLLAQF